MLKNPLRLKPSKLKLEVSCGTKVSPSEMAGERVEMSRAELDALIASSRAQAVGAARSRRELQNRPLNSGG